MAIWKSRATRGGSNTRCVAVAPSLWLGGRFRKGWFLAWAIGLIVVAGPLPAQSTSPTRSSPPSGQIESRPRLFSGRLAERKEEANRFLAANEQAKQETLRRIPWNALSPDAKSKVKGVLADVSLYHRIPEQMVYCEPWVYDFLLVHPDVVVAFWEKLGVTQISLRERNDSSRTAAWSRNGSGRDGPGVPEEPTRFRLRESIGTTADIDVLYKTPHVAVVYVKGHYRGPFFAKPIEGETLLVLQSRFAVDEDDDPYVVCRMEAFVNIHNPGADVMIKLLSGPVGKIANANFEQTVNFIGSVSEAIHENPRGVCKTVDLLPHVRREVLSDFQDQIAAFAVHRYDRDSLAEVLGVSRAGLRSPSAEDASRKPSPVEESTDKSFDPAWLMTLAREFGESVPESFPQGEAAPAAPDEKVANNVSESPLPLQSMRSERTGTPENAGPPESKRVIFKTPNIHLPSPPQPSG